MTDPTTYPGDLELRAAQGSFDEAVFEQLANHPQVALASPVLELSTQAVAGSDRVSLRVMGIDALVVAGLSPDLMPQPNAGADRLALLAPATVFLNASARQRLARNQR